MTDPEPDPELDPELDPEQDARIRALLAEVGTAETVIPPEVAARLDETVAGLVAERQETGQEPASNVVPLRRRWVPRAAAAAAAVIVLGAGGVAAANLGVFGGNDASSTSAEDSSAGGQAESFAGSSSETPAPRSPHAQTDVAALPIIASASFDSDVALLLQRDQANTPQDSTQSLRKAGRNGVVDGVVPGCTGPKGDGGSRREAVLYDGTPAVLVVHPPKQGERLVLAWTCAGDRVLARTHVPASSQTSPGDPGLGSPSPSP